LRLRLILMTSLAFGLHTVDTPSGYGTLVRNVLGTVAALGMGEATLVGVLLIPCSYVFIIKLFRIILSK
jgi:HAE1 family hydrophobic/amphiphilic exporter-1